MFLGKNNQSLPPVIFEFFESFYREIGKNVHLYMGVWGLSPPEASDISKNQIIWEPDIYFFLLFGSAP